MSGITENLTPQRRQQLVTQLRQTVAAIAYVQNASIQNSNGVIARNIIPSEDLTTGQDNSWDGTTREWKQDFSAGTADAFNDAYYISSGGGGKATDKVLGFLTVRNQTSPQSATTEIQFKNGTDALIETVPVQPLRSEPDATGYIVEYVIYTLNEDGTIKFYQTAAQEEHFILGGAVGEPATHTFSIPPVQPILSGDQQAKQIAKPYVQFAQREQAAGGAAPPATQG